MLNKDDVASKLANLHFQIEPGISRIFKIREKPDQEVLPSCPIKLLEINAATVPSGVMPLHFGPVPTSGIPFPSVIIEVTPEEFEHIKTKKLKLPKGWTIGPEYPKPSNGDGGE